MTLSDVKIGKELLFHLGIVTVAFAMAVVMETLPLHKAEAISTSAIPPYSSVWAFPDQYGGCLQSGWCDSYDGYSGNMYLYDSASTNQDIQSEVAWNVEPYWGNSPYVMYPDPSYYYPYGPSPWTYWGEVYDAIGTIQQTNYGFEGEAVVGTLVQECSNTSPTCAGGYYASVAFNEQPVEILGPNYNQALYNQQKGNWIYQDSNRLYVGIPIGFTWADGSDCNGSCQGSGYVDFGQNGNYVRVDQAYAYPW